SDVRRAHTLVARFGADTLAPFALRSDKRYFFAPGGTAVLAYRTVAGVALVSGDPIGREQEFEPLLAAFLDYAARRGWTVAALGVAQERLGLWRARGFRAHYTGDEAVVDVGAFSLDGRPIRKVRQSVHRLERAGYTVRIAHTSELDDALADRIEEIAESWRGGRSETGFSMAFDGAPPGLRRDGL